MKEIIGKSETEVARVLKKKGKILRVMQRNGKDHCGTCDFQPDRVNVAVEDGTITKFLGMG